ncbi:hypothetical protein [Alistipes sp.]|uniref:hypothetical protein n=1 Tax=Alistipes sp. TaxID=1872444 RepID=UPI003AF18457
MRDNAWASLSSQIEGGQSTTPLHAQPGALNMRITSKSASRLPDVPSVQKSLGLGLSDESVRMMRRSSIRAEAGRENSGPVKTTRRSKSPGG